MTNAPLPTSTEASGPVHASLPPSPSEASGPVQHVVFHDSPSSPIPIPGAGRRSPRQVDSPPSPTAFYHVSPCASDTSCDTYIEIELLDSDDSAASWDSDASAIYYSSDDAPEEEELIAYYNRMSTASSSEQDEVEIVESEDEHVSLSSNSG